MRYRISRSLLDEIRGEADAAAPEEACGLLFGEGEAVTGWTRTRNIAELPQTHFEIDPADLFAALRVERAGGAKVLGYWHSHPSGVAAPSATDTAMAAPDGKLWLIVAGNDVTAWCARETGFEAAAIDPTD